MDEKLKVTDKRMFNAEGELRDEFRDAAGEMPVAETGSGPSRAEAQAPVLDQPVAPSGETEAVPEPEPPAVADPESPVFGAAEVGELPKPGVMDLIGMLAQPIPMFLGDAPLPDGGSAENLEVARYHIDLLELLKNKTQGNLGSQEEQLLADLLYRLRMRYVEKVG